MDTEKKVAKMGDTTKPQGNLWHNGPLIQRSNLVLHKQPTNNLHQHTTTFSLETNPVEVKLSQ